VLRRILVNLIAIPALLPCRESCVLTTGLELSVPVHLYFIQTPSPRQE